jgi:zinc protease
LRESLREDKGMTYGVGIWDEPQKIPEEKYALGVSFGCKPENVDSMVAIVFDEMKKVMQEGPLEEDLVKVKEILKRDIEVKVKENIYWSDHLSHMLVYGMNFATQEDFVKAVDAVTAENIKNAANVFINLDNYVIVSLKPEQTTE